MIAMRGLAAIAALVGACALLSACGGTKKAAAPPPAPPKCAHPAGWQKLANQIKAPVYCPGWLPDPLTGWIGAQDNNINSASKDHSYLESWVWQETGGGAAGGELHVNLRAYPGRTRIPTCTDTRFVTKTKVVRTKVPCFSDAKGTKTVGGKKVTVYTVNQDADQWHVLYAWREHGSLYTVSEHVAPPLDYAKVVQYLDRIMRSLVRVEPTR
jgi:hypothetical protein